MSNKIDLLTKLGNPNDDSNGCYAPVENGIPNDTKKKHFNDGDAPTDWQRAPCSVECQFIKQTITARIQLNSRDNRNGDEREKLRFISRINEWRD